MPRGKKAVTEETTKPTATPSKKPFGIMVYAVGRSFELEFDTEQARHVEIVRFTQRSPKGMPVTVHGYTFIGPVVLESLDR